MIFKDLKFPEDIEPQLREADLVDFDKRDKKLLLAFSVLDQRQIWSINTFIEQIKILGETLEALEKKITQLEVQQELLIKSNQSQTWQWMIVKWASVVTLAAFIGAIIKKGLDKIWP